MLTVYHFIHIERYGIKLSRTLITYNNNINFNDKNHVFKDRKGLQIWIADNQEFCKGAVHKRRHTISDPLSPSSHFIVIRLVKSIDTKSLTTTVMPWRYLRGSHRTNWRTLEGLAHASIRWRVLYHSTIKIKYQLIQEQIQPN